MFVLLFCGLVLTDEFSVTRVLIFPPHIPPRYRFLLHQSISQTASPNCKTISLGTGDQRRTFVYDMSIVKRNGPDDRRASPPDSSSGRTKRPNKQLYQPPAVSPHAKSAAANGAVAATASSAEDESWDNLYDDEGDCLSPDLIKDFKSALSLSDDKDLKFVEAAGDYSDVCSSRTQFDLTDNEYPHVLEIYGFAENLKTPEIFARISGAG